MIATGDGEPANCHTNACDLKRTGPFNAFSLAPPTHRRRSRSRSRSRSRDRDYYRRDRRHHRDRRDDGRSSSGVPSGVPGVVPPLSSSVGFIGGSGPDTKLSRELFVGNTPPGTSEALLMQFLSG